MEIANEPRKLNYCYFDEIDKECRIGRGKRGAEISKKIYFMIFDAETLMSDTPNGDNGNRK